MTVATTPPRRDYVEDGATLQHDVPFQFFDQTELVVTRITAAGVDAGSAVLVLGVDYTVAGGNGETGSITKANGGTAGATLRIDRFTKRSQELNYQVNDDFPAELHEEGLDRALMIEQELERDQLDAEAVRDIIAAALRSGFGIRVDVDDALNTITIVNTAAEDIRTILDNMPDCVKLSGDAQTNDGAGGVIAQDRITVEDVRDTIGAALVAGDNITIAVDDAGDTITISAVFAGVVAGDLVAGTNITIADNGDGTFTVACTALDASYRHVVPAVEAGAFTFADADGGKGIYYTGAAATATIDDALLPIGWTTTIANDGTGVLTVAKNGNTLKVNGGTATKDAAIAQGGWATLQKWAAGIYKIAGPNVT